MTENEIPTDAELEKLLKATLNQRINEAVENYKFIWKALNLEQGSLLYGGFGASLALIDLRFSFIDGNYVATIILAQTFIEFDLGGKYFVQDDDVKGEMTFANLIRAAKNDGYIKTSMAEKLDILRKMRNTYSHSRKLSNRNSLPHRLTKKLEDSESSAFDDLIKEDAKEAIRILGEYFEHHIFQA